MATAKEIATSAFSLFGDVFGTSGKWTTIHLCLLVIRFFCIFLNGYPHPDEFFQSPEIAAADIFEFDVFIPWEFADISSPCRSIISPLIGSSIGYTVLYGIALILPSALNAFTLLVFPRFIIFILSLVTDYTVSKLSKWKGEDPGVVLFILSSSWTMLVMHTRPFSNILESFFVTVSILLYFVPKESITPPLRSWRYLMFGAVFSLGIFTRFTFVFFFFPVALGVLYELLFEDCYDMPLAFWSSSIPPTTKGPVRSVENRTTFFTKAVILGLSGIFFVASTLIILDSVYFGSFQLTVMNSFLYNLDSKNLAAHGIHPRYLHSLVNMHILFGPLWSFAVTFILYSVFTNMLSFAKNPKAFLYKTKIEEKSSRAPDDDSSVAPNVLVNDSWGMLRSRIDVPSMRKSMGDMGSSSLRASAEHQSTKFYYDSKRSWMILYVLLGSIVTGCGLLSVAQHQEPRFLLPLLLPLTVVFGRRFFDRKILVVAWILFNIALVVFFGILHQGGVVPSLRYVQQESGNEAGSLAGVSIHEEIGADLIYFKTFMPPRFLLAQPKKGQYPVRIHDPGRSEEKLLQIILDLQMDQCSLPGSAFKRAFILTPSLVTLPQAVNIDQTAKKTFWPHFSSEDLPLQVSDIWSSSLNLYSIQFSCNNTK